MLRSSVLRSSIRRYATAQPTSTTEGQGSQQVLKNLLEKVKSIKTSAPQQQPKSFVNRQRSNNNNNNKNSRPRGQTNNKGNNQNRRTRFANKNQGYDSKFSSEEYLKQRRTQREKKFGSNTEAQVFDSTQPQQSRSRRNRPARTSIFLAPKGAKSQRTRTRQSRNSEASQRQAFTLPTELEIYTPEVPALPDLIRFSSKLAFSAESRLTRAMFQVFQQQLQVPEWYGELSLSSQGRIPMVQQPISQYPFYDRLPLTKGKIMGPMISDVDFEVDANLKLLNDTIERTVFGKFSDLKINVSDDKLKFNAIVVQNALNCNPFLNYSGRKEKIYKSCAGIAPVKDLLQ